MITEYLLPGSAEEAAAELGAEVAVMGGGTTVMPAVHAGTLDASRVVGLARAGLAGIERDGGRTTIGAMTPLAAVAELDGAVGAAARAVGGPALRNMATVGGNLLARAPYGDVGVALLALDAEVRLSGRTIPLDELWSSFRPGEEIVEAVAFEDDPDSVFVRHARRAANSPAVVCVAVSRGRVALGGVAPHPVRSVADPERAAEEIDPPSDALASAWYRRRMTALFVRRALEQSDAV
jgi:aerobic carbon-monoxide dehydrogenase medium subunit